MKEQQTSIPRTLPRLTILLAVVNTAVFLLMWRQASFDSLSNSLLLDWGANFAPYTLTGQPWRLLTSAFLHGGWQHLLLNLYMLVVLGSVLERVGGSTRFGVTYLLSALGGSLASALWYGYHEVSSMSFAFGVALPTSGIQPVVSVGASGALMGLAGAAGAFALRMDLERGRAAPMIIDLKAVAQVIVINLVSGFFISGIDQAAHVGGVVTGFVVGWVLYRAQASGRTPAGVVLPFAVAVVGSAAMLGAAQYASSADLKEMRIDVDRDRAQQADQQNDQQTDQQESGAIAAQSRDDEQHRPASVLP
ncbi:rhomboid family intramembrane serine protease [Burkholderia sp. Ac-20353]|uniref:rhomboid family intramembrane serine protease n=1 Tax=Burkholderia sp. Ac-20353 TaxID=2703894 RepID=UPI001F119678|nr:rhomboid family intramembrane serine protease [Burkholderia sp. Ac-20353]